MIVALNGLKQSGKDTVAAYLIKEYGFERRAFADPMKKSIAALFDIPFHEIDKLKTDDGFSVNLLDGGERISSLTFREFLQRYGTEAHRGVFGENFWLDYTLPKNAYYAGRKIVITDLRFENEAHRIRDCGGYVVGIHRPGLDGSDLHSSEKPLPTSEIDLILMNDGTLADLEKHTNAMLTYLGEKAVSHG